MDEDKSVEVGVIMVMEGEVDGIRPQGKNYRYENQRSERGYLCVSLGA